MAENTTTYSVVVETEVTGQDQVQGLGSEAEGTGGKFKSLRTQIRETTVQLQKLADEGQAGTAEFEKLRAKLDELNDAQEKVSFQAGQFDDQLAALPGPLGAVGSGIRNFNEGLNKFSTGFKLALGAITLIVGAIAAFRESLSRTEEGQAKLNKITEAFEKIMNGVFAVIEPVAMALADLLAGLLENEQVMKVLSTTMGVLAGTFTTVIGVAKELGGFIINNLVNYFKTLIGVAQGAGKVLKGVFTFDLALIKEGVAQVGETVKKGVTTFVDNVKSTAKGIGDSVVNGVKTGFEAGSKAFTDGTKRLTEAEKKAAEERKKKAAENGKKLAEEEKKLQEQRLKEIEAGNKIVTEAYLAGLEERDREIYKRGLKLNEDIVTLEKKREAQIADILKKAGVNISKVIDESTGKIKFQLPEVKTALAKRAKEVKAAEDEFNSGRLATQEAYNKDLAAINKKFDEEEQKKKDEKKQKEREAAKAALEEAELANENQVRLIEKRYNKEIALVNDSEKTKKEAAKLATSEALKNVQLTEEERKRAIANGISEVQALELKRESIIKDGTVKIQQIESDAATQRQALQTSKYDELIAAVNEREKLLLSNTELTEAQKTKILLDAEAERAQIQQTRREDELLANENSIKLIEQRYNREIALVNDKERMKIEAIKLVTSEALANLQLTEEERKNAISRGISEAQALEIKREEIIRDGTAKIAQIESDAATTRLALQQGRYDELIAAINEKEQILLSNAELTEAQKTKILLDAEAERAVIQKTRRDDEILGIENELNNIATTYDRRRELIGQKEAELLAQEGLTENQRIQIRQQAADERKAIDMAELEARAELQTAYLDLAQNFGSFLQQIAGKNKKLAIAGVIVEQAAAIGKIVVNTGIANAKALAASPLTGGMPWVAINVATAALSIAASIAGAAKAIQQIKNSDSGTAPASGGTTLPKSAGGGGAAPMAEPKAPTLAGQTAIPQITGTQGQATPGQQIAQTLAARTDQPIKAYVVSGDVTSQQALDRRTTRAATFSGGTNG